MCKGKGLKEVSSSCEKSLWLLLVWFRGREEGKKTQGTLDKGWGWRETLTCLEMASCRAR